jgi:hypothetical protein
MFARNWPHELHWGVIRHLLRRPLKRAACAPIADLRRNAFGDSGAVQVARDNAAQIGKCGQERRLGTEPPERPYSRLKII